MSSFNVAFYKIRGLEVKGVIETRAAIAAGEARL
jgi:hypothetical protein